jgi:DNA-nicking Smr family endonuclease
MKKKETKKKAAGEFSVSPFKTLKGLQAKAAEPPVRREPPQQLPAGEEDDEDLFFRAVADVKPLNPVAGGVKTQQNKPPQRPTPVPPAERNLFLQTVENLVMDVVFTDELPEDVMPLRPLPVNRLRQLKRRAIHIDYELDLHGLKKDEALASLANFIASAHNRGKKGVLVITGKGNNSPEGPVLQAAVASWLRDKGKAMVAEFAPAPSRLGGSGAFVVFLKEKKDVSARN